MASSGLNWGELDQLLKKNLFKLDQCEKIFSKTSNIRAETVEPVAEEDDNLEIKTHFYETALKRWSGIPANDIPKMSDLPGIRVLKSSGKALSTPEEWSDNYHPCWKEERKLVQKVLLNEIPHLEIAKSVNIKWGKNRDINTFKDTSTFPMDELDHYVEEKIDKELNQQVV